MSEQVLTITILSFSYFTWFHPLHLVAFKVFLKAVFRLSTSHLKNIVRWLIHELLQQKKKDGQWFLPYIFIGTCVLHKNSCFYKAIGIWKGKYACLNIVYFDLAYI